jgi:hypothetical protein
VADDGAMADFGYLIEELAGKLHGNFETESLAKIVQSLTRIEDAEHALSRASLVYFGRTAREQNEADAIADELFAKAGIDPHKWREVKDEEA